MSKPTMYVIMGYSGSGKDTIGNYIVDKRKASSIKFSYPAKRALEFMLKIPERLLDDRKARNQIAPNCQGRTYLQVLIDFWEHRDLVVGPDLFTSQTSEKLLWLALKNKDVVITDVRNFDEANCILNLADLYSIEIIWVAKRLTIGLRSDVNQCSIYKKLASCSESTQRISNDGSFDALYHAVDDFIGR